MVKVLLTVLKFVAFRDRVDRIKIDPIRRVGWRPAENAKTSYFLTAFNHWAELNISSNFSEFVQECHDLCLSLPLIIHNQESIVNLLLKYIDLKDEHSLESLLEYVSIKTVV